MSEHNKIIKNEIKDAEDRVYADKYTVRPLSDHGEGLFFYGVF